MQANLTLKVVLPGLLLAAGLVSPGYGKAQSLADYTSTPTFVSDSVPPNILIVFDNSGSMQIMAFEAAPFSNSTSYTGIYDPTECYQYLTSPTERFVGDPGVNPATPGTCSNASYPWSGNLLNYGTMRRIDIAKQVMIGGNCDTARDAQDKCATIIKGQDGNLDKGDKQISVASSGLTNLMPSSMLSGIGSTVYFHHAGDSVTALAGYFCIDDDSSYPSSSTCSDGDSYSEPGRFRIAVEVTTPSSGVLQEIGDKARFAMMKYASGQDGGPLIAEIGTSSSSLVNTLDATLPPGGTGTPLSEMLYEAARYFAQIAPPYLATDYTHTDINKDPYYFTAPQWASTSAYVRCCKSYVILFTDGEPTSDQAIPGDDGSGNGVCAGGAGSLCDLAHAIHGTHCTGAGCSGHRTDYGNGSHYLDDVAYWAHTTDLRQPTIPVLGEAGKDLPGFQNLTVYTFFAFGTDSELLKSAAKAGGFQDLNANNLPDLTDEWDRLNNLTGADGADGIPDNYFESDDANLLKDRLLAAITSILQRSGAGSAASVLASSSTGEGAVYQSFFYPSTVESLRDIKWTGHTHGLFLDAFGNLREDTNGDAKLVYTDDKIIRTTFDTTTNQVMVERYDDANGDGVADSATPIGGAVDLRAVNAVWEAGEQLALTTSAARDITTWVDLDNDGLVDGGEQIAFTTANASTLAPYLRPSAAPFTTDNIINFVRGDQVNGLRDRELTVGGSLKVWKLGDAIHARPITVGPPAQRYDIIYGDSTYTAFLNQYKNRRQVVYVGANDGMLHGFNGGYFHPGDDASTTTKTEHGWFTRTPTDNSGGPLLGDELFGFIPQELLPHLKWLTQPDYTHVYYVDLTPKVTEARIFTPDADHPNGWGTILMGGFRMGGSCAACTAATGAPPMTVTADFNNDGDTVDPDDTRTFYSAYFVLDITNPESATFPKLLWSFTSTDLGLATNTPSMLRVNPTSATVTDNTDAKWYMVVGSGPTAYDAGVSQVGKLYAVDLAQGPGVNNGQVSTLPAETFNAFLGSTVTIDRDFDYRVDVAYMGSVINDGSLPWRGKLYRLTMNDCTATPCSTNTWGIASGTDRQPTEILNTFPLSGTIELGPIATSPAVAIDQRDKLWIFAGTGRYFDSVDKSNTDTQHFVGVKDSVLNGGCTESTRTNCQDNDLVDVSSAQVCLIGVGNCGSVTDQVTGVSGATDFPSLIGLVASKDGWYTTLPTVGERALFRPLVIGGLVLFPTFVPTNDVCTSTGDSYMYVLYYLTGSAYSAPVVGTTSSGPNKNVNRSIALGSGMTSEAVVHIGQGGSGGKATAYIQKSTAELTAISFNTPGVVPSRFLTWYNTRD